MRMNCTLISHYPCNRFEQCISWMSANGSTLRWQHRGLLCTVSRRRSSLGGAAGGIRHLWPPALSTVSCSLRCQRDQIHQQQPVCHMTSVQLSTPVCVCVCMCVCVCVCVCEAFYFRVHRVESWAEWVSTAALCLSFTPRNCCVSVRGSVARGEARAIASPGPTLLHHHHHHHAYAGEIGGGQFHGRYDGWRLQRGPSRRLGSAAEVPVQQTGVPGAVSGRDRVLGGPHRETDPHPEGDQAAAVVHRLRRVSKPVCVHLFLHGAQSILLGSERVLPGPRRKHKHPAPILSLLSSLLLWHDSCGY